MARMRSARKHDVPLRRPRRKSVPSPVSARIEAPSSFTRRTISSAEKTTSSCSAADCGMEKVYPVLPAFQPSFKTTSSLQAQHIHVAVAPGRLEPLGNGNSCNPDDLAVPDHEREPVARFARDLPRDEKALQLRLRGIAEGMEAVARLPTADRERRICALRELNALPVGGGWSSGDRN